MGTIGREREVLNSGMARTASSKQKKSQTDDM